MTTGACCNREYGPGGSSSGPGSGRRGRYPSLPSGGGVIAGGAPGQTIVDKVAAALDAAIHGGDSVGSYGSGSGSASAGSGNVIPFPMINPYKPLLRTRVPVAGLNAFPNVERNAMVNFSKRDTIFNERGERDQSAGSADGMPEGATSLGFLSPSDTIPSGIGLPGQPSNLQLILSSINQGLQTVPAILSARKKQPYYDPNSGGQYGTGEGGSYGQPGANIGSQVGGAVGNVGDTFGNIIAQHPYLVLAAGAAAFLLFMQPPRRR